MKRASKLGILLATVLLLAGVTWFSQKETAPADTAQGTSAVQPESAAGEATKSVAERPTRPYPNHHAPDFTLTDLEGQPVQLSSLKGKKVFINFWASWCPPCKAEMPDLVEMSKKYQGQVEFYGVNLTTQDTVEKAKGFVKEYGIEFPTLLDERGEVGGRYGVVSIPTSFTIDENGVVVQRTGGQLSRSAMEEMLQDVIGR